MLLVRYSDRKPNATCLLILVVVGGFVASQLPGLPEVSSSLPVALASLVAFCALFGRAGLAAGFGFAWFIVSAVQFDAERWPLSRWNEEREAVFEVVDFVTGDSNHFSLWVRPLAGQDLPAKIRLSWYRSSIRPKLGEHWRWRIRLRTPSGTANPGAFDYERWLWASGVGATGYIVAGDHNVRVDRAHVARFSSGRLQLREHLYAVLPESRARAVIVALLLGSRADFDQATRELFVRTATSHLVAISGLHIGLVAVFSVSSLRLLSAPMLLLRRRPLTRGLTGSLAFLAAVLYAILAGWGLPTQRALIMLAGGLTVWVSARRTQALRSLALALTAMFLYRPQNLYTAAYYLSFGAVSVLLLLAWRDRCIARRAGFSGVRWQWMLSILSLPLGVTLFGQIAVAGPIANMLLIPVFALLIVPLLLISLLLVPWPTANQQLLTFAHALIEYALQCMEILAGIDGLFIYTAAAGPLNLVAATLLGILVLCPFRMLGKVPVGLALATLAMPRGLAAPPPGCVRATLLDVGQGQALILSTHSATVLYDTGPRYASGATAAARVILPVLRFAGQNPSRVVISHADLDHAGGFTTLLKAYPQADFVYSAKSPPHTGCNTNLAWRLDKVDFEILHPPAGAKFVNSNASSCVLKVSTGQHALLATGDIGAREEHALLSQATEKLRADILVVPHHGSETSSSAAFVDAVAPRYAWVSAGFRNRWNFPRPTVVARYQSRGARVQVTGDSGALSATLCPDAMSVESGFRHTNRAIYHRTALQAEFDSSARPAK